MILLALDDRTLQRLADLLAERLRDTSASATSPRWLTAADAAEHLAAPLSRVRKLTATGELPHHKEGRRVLYNRDELDNYVRGCSGARAELASAKAPSRRANGRGHGSPT